MSAWSGKRVLITGHTGFKGSWLTILLAELGADVYGYSLAPPTDPNMFELCGIEERIVSKRGDIKDLNGLKEYMTASEPEAVFHLAAQSLVRRSYAEPIETFETNIMGTANVIEAARLTPSVNAIVNVTSDKCYENRINVKTHIEGDPMGGADPYSASKGCAELISTAYAQSFSVPIATVRAGNVIGGGDWGVDRLVPDCIRSLGVNEPIIVRNPLSIRPWQHVLDPITGYVAIAENLLEEPSKWTGGWNFGPTLEKDVPVKEVVAKIIKYWGSGSLELALEPDAPQEASYLSLDSSKVHRSIDWRSRLDLDEAIDWSISWYRNVIDGAMPNEMYEYTINQIRDYLKLGVTA